jgi:hypothetical protein
VTTDRRLIAHSGTVSLEERTGAPDVTVASGLFLSPSPQVAGSGTAWVGPTPLTFVVVGATQQRRVWVSLAFDAGGPVEIEAPDGQQGGASTGPGNVLHVCIQATGTGPVRFAEIKLLSDFMQPPLSHDTYAPVPSPRNARLTSMLASDVGCLAS